MKTNITLEVRLENGAKITPTKEQIDKINEFVVKTIIGKTNNKSETKRRISANRYSKRGHKVWKDSELKELYRLDDFERNTKEFYREVSKLARELGRSKSSITMKYSRITGVYKDCKKDNKRNYIVDGVNYLRVDSVS